ncbi:ABC transporter permease [Parapedobacter koreensis]|uniref:FtsX-like permease family protein n=1 Tax=Parapedobacter koreensis TaxID=332977 RepID=A0A1H7R1M3_9SPHI|nr:ABC transporter permease [Parapedobacter koreensis]SEL54073.1 FtsX-like permease family protein [Parapedobacter koreensis]
MLKNHFKTAWRSLRGNKFYSIINTCGLAFGLATAMLLLLWVQHERSYDRFHSDYQRTYKILAHFEANGQDMVWEGVPGPLSVYAQSIPRVESIVRVYSEYDQVLANADRSKVLDGFVAACVDSTFLTVFDFELLQGNRTAPFPNNNSVVVTQSTARKFFGDGDAMGKVLQFRGDNFTVAGVLRDFPDNSSLVCDALFPMGYYAQQFTANGGNGDWKTIDADLGNYAFHTYVKLQEGTDPIDAEQDFTAAYDKARNGESDTRYGLQSLASLHLVGPDGNDASARMVRIFLIIAILVLAIAAINYINLSTARALVRAREVGIRKVVGASRRQLFFQFIVETTLLFCFALAIAIGLILALLPVYNLIAGKQLHFSFADTDIWKVVGYSAVGTLLSASIYPALLLSDFRPLQVLKGKITSGIGTTLFRKILVVFQFSISTVLIVATLVIGKQLDYIRKLDLGYNKDYVFTVPLPDAVSGHIDALKNELNSQQGITGISLTDIYDLSNHESSTSDLEWSGKPTNSQVIINQAVIDQHFIPTVGIQLLEGRNFSGTPADSNLYIVNEAAVKEMGLTPPYVGQPISFHSRAGTIIGVVRDFNFQSLKKKIEPLLFFRWWNGNMLYVRTSAQAAQQAIAAVEKQYKQYAGDIPFSYSFLDKQFEAKYQADQRAGLLFNIFAGIAIFISCLGLLGLSTYTVRQRVKEIGIRKVLGASVGNIVGLLSKGSIQLVLVSIIMGTPIAWWTMNTWLEDFAYRIDVEWWMFAVAGSAAVVIALLTVSWQAIRAALANPVESLRDE